MASAGDLKAAEAYASLVRYLMFDAKTPPDAAMPGGDAAMPGGLGLSFDWPIMRGYDGNKPWFLAAV
ncbi:MAG: hypothetical protein WDN06_21825 [Asticcacaulis sp.]